MSSPRISTSVLWFFRRIVRGYFGRHFHAVRVTGAARFIEAGVSGEPMMIYANHGSWWDPMVAILLGDKMMRGRRHFAPMDAEALARYPILRHVGIFPVEMESGRGAVQFLRSGDEIVCRGGVLWVTPQGEFVDARVRPLEFKPGLALLATRVAAKMGSCTVLPLAIEYTFWDERLPECLLGFAPGVRVLAGEEAEAVEMRLKDALVAAMDDLKRRGVARDAVAFEVLATGSLGTGGFYGLGQRLKAAVMRRPYRPEHTPVRRGVTVGPQEHEDA